MSGAPTLRTAASIVYGSPSWPIAAKPGPNSLTCILEARKALPHGSDAAAPARISLGSPGSLAEAAAGWIGTHSSCIGANHSCNKLFSAEGRFEGLHCTIDAIKPSAAGDNGFFHACKS